MRTSTVAALTLSGIVILGLGLIDALPAEAATLFVARSGRGSVTGTIVTGTVISCPSDCSEFFLLGGSITLTATPAAGWTFGRWAGQCTGSTSRTCTVTVPVIGDVTVTATFDAKQAAFTVNNGFDAVDADPGNGVCATSGGICTLRAAIQETNALVRAPGAHTIMLPAGTHLLTIDGGNEDQSATGDLDIRNAVTIVGAGTSATIVEARVVDRVFHVFPTSAFVRMSRLTIRKGRTDRQGGGLSNHGPLQLDNVAITDNTISSSSFTGNGGGGVFNDGFIELTDSTISGNASSLAGGGLFNDGDATLVGVTISGNTSPIFEGGGGMVNWIDARASLTNVTISGNRSRDSGGGILNRGDLGLINVTISGNMAEVGSGGGFFNAHVPRLRNVILAGNTAPESGNCGTIGPSPFFSQGNNLSSDGSCTAWFTVPGDRNNTEARLGPLQPNGGPTQTHALLPGSAAIDGGDACIPANNDQRGSPRPVGAACDIGAVEFQSPREEFVIGFYGGVLHRNPEPAGLATWVAALGADCSPVGFAAIARGFFDSEEFRTVRPHSLNGLASLLYLTFLGRDPDAGGLAAWADILRQVRLAVALQGFVPSPEFQTLLPDRTNRAAVSALVTRLYQRILLRNPEPTGLQAWIDYIVSTQDLEGAAAGFLASPEFESRPQTARDYIETLYLTFLNRTPEPAGVDAWEAILRNALLTVINTGFVPSAEFQGLVPQVCG